MIIKVDMSLDCKGLACPMPIVKTKKAIEGLASGQVIEIKATDKRIYSRYTKLGK